MVKQPAAAHQDFVQKVRSICEKEFVLVANDVPSSSSLQPYPILSLSLSHECLKK